MPTTNTILSAWAMSLDTRTNEQIWADYSDADLRCKYEGAWNACDGATAWRCKMEWVRRGVAADKLPGWPREAR